MNINFFYFSRNFFTHEDIPLDLDSKKILLKEIELIEKNFNKIKFIDIEKLNTHTIDSDLKEKVKLISAKSIIAYDQILSVHNANQYSQISNYIKNKSYLKAVHIEHLMFAKKIINLVRQNQHWINHNSNIGVGGILHEVLELKKSNYTSHEYRGKHLEGKSNHQIMILNNKPVLSFLIDEASIKNFIKNANISTIRAGTEYIEERFKSNFSQNELNKFLMDNPIIKLTNKNRIFIFYSNVLSESKYQYKEHHPIFEDFKDFFYSLVKYFNNSDYLLIIKCHPAEFNLRNKFDENLKSIYEKCKSKNAILIYNKEPSSYSLSSITDNIIVYDSDIGAEMIYKNKTVIAGGNPRYKKFGIGEFPKDKSDFFLNIKKLSEGNNYTNIKDQKKRKMLASLFFFHYIKNQFDEIPFKYGDSSNQISNCNFEELFPTIVDSNYPPIIKLCL